MAQPPPKAFPKPPPPGGIRRLKVWDPWIRLVHWAIVLLLPFQYWTAQTDRWDWHMRGGYVILMLLLFRIAWGFVGSHTARFSRFLKSPMEAVRHLTHLRRRHAGVEIGHNAAGGWMVLVLLLLLLTQAVSGLFANDEIFTRGPLARSVDEATSATMTSIHLRAFWVIVAAAVLHVLAIVAYRVLRGQNLVGPMITGSLKLPFAYRGPVPRMGHPLLAIALLAAAMCLVWWISIQGQSGGGFD